MVKERENFIGICQTCAVGDGSGFGPKHSLHKDFLPSPRITEKVHIQGQGSHKTTKSVLTREVFSFFLEIVKLRSQESQIGSRLHLNIHES